MDKEDWRLTCDIQHLKGQRLLPTDGEELSVSLPQLQQCVFCRDKIADNMRGRWYLPPDPSCCIREKCCGDFADFFQWKLLDGYDVTW